MQKRSKQGGGLGLSPSGDSLSSAKSSFCVGTKSNFSHVSILLVLVALLWFANEQQNIAILSSSTEKNECSNVELYKNPEKFESCIRPDPKPSCTDKQKSDWDAWVGVRYKEYNECITPEPMEKLGRTWAISGRGSTVAVTAPVRTILTQIFADPTLNVKTFLDCPCGDWLWMQEMDFDKAPHDKIQYFGADITKYTVNENNKCFRRDNVRFVELDWTCSIPPPVDLILVRDVLFHLSTATNLHILDHINQSGARYLLTTSFPNVGSGGAVDDYTVDKVGYRDISLYAPPYNFPAPILQADEPGATGRGRHVGLWQLPLENVDFGFQPKSA